MEKDVTQNFTWKAAFRKLFLAIVWFIMLSIIGLVILGVIMGGSKDGGENWGPGLGLALIFVAVVLPISALIAILVVSVKSPKGTRLKYFFALALFIGALAALWGAGMVAIVKTKDILGSSSTMCKLEPSQEKKDYCYKEQARINKDLTICEQSSTQDSCIDAYYFDLSRAGNNIDFCKQSPRPDKCFYDNIKFRADYNLFLDKNIETYKSICNSIGGVQLKNGCIELLNENFK
ncbi:MAG: hypothetical protein ACD_81C00218G0008 [uncultured bacterium]|uniref:Uncharacterized protein n=2 Tax=Candidatus Wolfeibacteriota TaxID=1752735 RepID=A0A0G1HAD3_9BACT|nr:MAG: hypothetical protein ACD_81C00218G0008 [uncultured bacterium]KKR12784.1 MAG: hypothetical protein UT41_C0001G0328 [Candidatus Wolfebacteria bacterium GW2011_GWC2_39_22]KKT43715.1 MAG: hypothetical protein UW32_C0001G0307 [Candidatus Wolfebacteria bacterium GW2011_GWE2_44_13]HBI25554.1 hypothetical protein [Candidatus Wolfebacteria bacterium]